MFNKILFIRYHSHGFPNSVKVYGGISPSGGGNGKFCRGKCFYLVTNSSLKLKMNICILELSILFPKNLLFLYYIQLTQFWFFLRKNRYFFICFIVLFYPGYVVDFMMIPYHDTQFKFSKLENATFTDQFHLLILF